MARVTCAISGIRFKCTFFDSLSIPHTEGYIHPVFALSRKKLLAIYSQHCQGKLSIADSYLLFMALLHSSEQIHWHHPATCNPAEPRTKQLIENNIKRLVSVLAKTDAILHPNFTQPSFNVTYETCSLASVPNWIKAWNENIADFYAGRADTKEIQALQVLENRLSYLILSGQEPSTFANVIADWAAKAGDFPSFKAEEYKKVICGCFSVNKMFNTPLSLIKEIKAYCEENIEVGSIHFHTLYEVLNEGIARHIDYLGDYTLLPLESPGDSTNNSAEFKGQAELLSLASKAPDKEPEKKDYSTSLEFLRAKLAYRVAAGLAKQAATQTNKGIL